MQFDKAYCCPPDVIFRFIKIWVPLFNTKKSFLSSFYTKTKQACWPLWKFEKWNIILLHHQTIISKPIVVDWSLRGKMSPNPPELIERWRLGEPSEVPTRLSTVAPPNQSAPTPPSVLREWVLDNRKVKSEEKMTFTLFEKCKWKKWLEIGIEKWKWNKNEWKSRSRSESEMKKLWDREVKFLKNSREFLRFQKLILTYFVLGSAPSLNS